MIKLTRVQLLLSLALVAVLLLGGCAEAPPADEPVDEEPEASDEADTGSLVFTADGEEFIREGFLSKDGWELAFDGAYVTTDNIVAYQTDPPYDTSEGREIDYQTRVELPEEYTVNLADPASDPAVLDTLADVPAGHYNAISWEMVPATTGPAEGYSLLLEGTAQKDDEEIGFTVAIDKGIAYQGGEFIGDERKGIVEPGDTAELEMTYHFDHFFGDGEEDPDDPMNQSALGFEPLAALAVDGTVETDMAALEEQLSAEDFELLLGILTHLAHVGEGHCLAEFTD